jgi:hypothetical protein
MSEELNNNNDNNSSSLRKSQTIEMWKKPVEYLVSLSQWAKGLQLSDDTPISLLGTDAYLPAKRRSIRVPSAAEWVSRP